MKQLSQKRAFNKLAKQLKRERKNAKPAPHFSNTSNPVDFPVTKYVHIVQIHPVSYGKVNLNQVMVEREFKTKKEALVYAQEKNMSILNIHTLAVYHGRVNDETGELE